jgi:hypothetical protein
MTGYGMSGLRHHPAETGPRWQTRLARALPDSTRTIRSWLAGKRAICPVIAEQIRGLEAEGVAGAAGRREKSSREVREVFRATALLPLQRESGLFRRK